MKKHLAFFLCLGLLMTANIMFAQPANDDCSGAVPLTVAADEASAVGVSGTTVGGTASGAPLSPISVCSGSWFSDDVWYSFTTGATVPQNGVTVKVIPGTMTLLGIAIYTSCDTAAQSIDCMSSDEHFTTQEKFQLDQYLRLFARNQLVSDALLGLSVKMFLKFKDSPEAYVWPLPKSPSALVPFLAHIPASCR